MSADALERELAVLGVPCHVEVRARLAVLRLHAAAPPDAMLDAELRRQIGRLATSLGFSHVAVELPGDVRGETA